MQIQSTSTSVVVPFYNERDSLPETFRRLEAVVAARPDWEVLFVDDGSTDGGAAYLRDAIGGAQWAHVIPHDENLGLSAALKTGFAAARGEIICTIDSDCTYPPERMGELVQAVREGAHIATASPWHPEAADGSGGFRFFVSRLTSWLHSLVLGRRIYTLTSLYRAYAAPVVKEIVPVSSGFGAGAELLIRASLAGYEIHEVPIPLAVRQHGVSKMRFLGSVVEHLVLMVRTMAWRLRPALVAPQRNIRGL